MDGSIVREKSTQAQVDEMDIMQNIEGIKKGYFFKHILLLDQVDVIKFFLKNILYLFQHHQ